MVGILLTGHGKISEGIMSSVELIFGETNAKYINFLKENSQEVLKENIKNAIIELANDNKDGVLCLTDVAGGSPFKMCAELSIELDINIKVVSGMNLPAVISAVSEADCSNLDELTNNTIEAGKDGVELLAFKKREVIEEEDGI